MTKKGIVTKTAGVLVAMVLTVMFALPTFAAGYSPEVEVQVTQRFLDEYILIGMVQEHIWKHRQMQI